MKGCSGVDWTDTLTLGRLNLHLCNSELKRVLGGDLCSSGRYDSSERYAEPFFQLLRATKVESLDASGFEGASIVHDLNLFVPEILWEKFTVICDAGTLEHIFDIREALFNCYLMLQTGGHLTISSPTNNYCGHGFYQFSPEFWFRALSPGRGWQIQSIRVVEYGPIVRIYNVEDPAIAGRRTYMINR